MKGKLLAAMAAVALIASLVTVGNEQRSVTAAEPLVPGTTPHYFGPYPNYANSPLRMSDAVVDFVGGGGYGASALAQVDAETGAITGFTVLDGGADYTSAPDVVVTSPVAGGSGAEAVATIAHGVTSIEMKKRGSGYTEPPVVTIEGAGVGATAEPVMAGYVSDLTIGLSGAGYVDPVIEIEPPDDPNGRQALAELVQTNGEITSVSIVDGGAGYGAEPAVIVYDLAGENLSARVRATVTADTVSAIDVTAPGSGYTSATVVIAPPDTAGETAQAIAFVSGAVVSVEVVNGGSGYVTPGGIKKFVDTLPGLGEENANNLGQYIPVAVPDTTTYPGTDYYEIGIVQYREQMHSDLPPTLMRGYVQLSTSVVPGKHVALTNAPLDTNLPNAPVLLDGQQVFGVDYPHQYGPFIEATKDRPVRVLFRNLLPTGTDGNLFLPVDTTVMGSGMGPLMGNMMDPDPYNPTCSEIPKPWGCYSENRATLHLHGGITPWISDGTPHQWVTPAGENTAYPKGVSVSNVPDMPDPGPGAITFFYTNQQSARLLFYHDHSYGITRLNVYAGGAAGYTITDPMEQALVADGTLPSIQIPLILADKTFVPDMAQLAMEDPTWDVSRWGGEGNLWLPHVYMPAQNPGSSTGSNDFGRWAYGPWFWPPTTNITYGPTDNPYYDPNCNSEVEFCEPPLIPGTPNVSMGMESFMDTPLVNGTAYPTVTLQPRAYRFRVLNAADDRYFNLQLYRADSTGTEVALNADEVLAALTDPTVFPTPDTSLSPAGPAWIQIGTEGGLLPAPVIVPQQPITWVTDPTVFNAGNVDQHSLLVGPAERADVVVDFSRYAGQTLILYNDAPAAYPARDPRYDYYTGNPDLTSTGGAPSTLPGYGPNTRTVMQIKIAPAPVAMPFNYSRLVRAFMHTPNDTGAFEASQNPIIVGQAGYNSAYGTNFRSSAPNDGFVRITDNELTFKTLAGGASGPSMSIAMEKKALHDEMGGVFDPIYGRMSGELGVEDPNALAGAQNTYLYPFVDPATEVFQGIELPPGVDITPIASADDGTQIWKITHNGVDTHTLHWHLYDVQVINRVGWDGIIRPPEATELGWKDTVRVSPLEDTIIAMRPIIPKIPFGVPDSVRLLDPTMPEGTSFQFNQASPNGLLNVVNMKVNFGWEYVWHCHLLTHEEMDMMRPQAVFVQTVLPTAPVLTRDGETATFTWTDGTPVTTSMDTWGDPSNEIGFRVERANVVNGVVGPYSVVATALANQTTFTDLTMDATAWYRYRVVAFNASGDSASNVIEVVPVTYTISGRVTAAGHGVANARVTLYSTTGVNLTSAVTNAQGDYSIVWIPGSYRLYVQPGVTGYPSQWYGGASQAVATVFSVSGDTTINLPLAGTPAFTLSGSVTFAGGGANGQSANGARISVYDALTGRSLTTVVVANGNYSIVLAPGSYKLYIRPNRGGYVSQWYGGTSQGTATVITITGDTTLNIGVHT